MAHTACLVCLISTVCGFSKKSKNALGEGGASSWHMKKLEQSRFHLDVYGSLLKLDVYSLNKHSTRKTL
jgi:hypothetical protein